MLADSQAIVRAPAAWGASRTTRVGVVVVGDIPDEVLPAGKIVRVTELSTLPIAIDGLLIQFPKGKICSLRRMQDELRERRRQLQIRRQQMLFKQKQLGENVKVLLKRQQDLCDILLSRSMHPTDSTRLTLLKRLQYYQAKLESLAQSYGAENADIFEQDEFASHRARFLKRQEDALGDSILEL